MTEPGSDGNLRYTGDGTEDMSLSSASSLERNDTSEEFLDDFDNLGDQSQNGILHNKNPLATPTQMRMQSFLNETMDWTGIGLAGKAESLCLAFLHLCDKQYRADNFVLVVASLHFMLLYHVCSQVARQI